MFCFFVNNMDQRFVAVIHSHDYLISSYISHTVHVRRREEGKPQLLVERLQRASEGGRHHLAGGLNVY